MGLTENRSHSHAHFQGHTSHSSHRSHSSHVCEAVAGEENWKRRALAAIAVAVLLLLCCATGCHSDRDSKTKERAAGPVGTAAAASGSEDKAKAQRPVFTATIAPLGMILREVAGERAEVQVLLPPNASPHIYEPRPSDIRTVQNSLALFYVSPALDAWAAQLPPPGAHCYEVLDWLPLGERLRFADFHDQHGGNDHAHAGAAREIGENELDGEVDDPHFWTDPLAVRAILPSLAKTLGELDSAARAEYQANADRFAARLDAIDKEARAILTPVRGRPVFLFHPSFAYMLRRYELDYAGVISSSPGKEPSPKELAMLVARIEKTGAKAIFTEPQLPRRPAEVLAEAAHVRLAVLDPIGGKPPFDTYEHWLLRNARVLRESLE